MIELTFSILAWLGVVVIQAVVHAYFGARKRLLVQLKSSKSVDDESDDLLTLPLYDNASNISNLPCSHESTSVDAVEEPDESDLEEALSAIPFLQKSLFLDSSCHASGHDVEDIRPTMENSHPLIMIPPSDDISVAQTDDEEPLDGDEPQLYFHLMSQTGAEMMQTCRSIETLVQEQINLVCVE